MANEDVEMMKSPMDWPRFPMLPVVGKDEKLLTGILITDGEPHVHVGNMFDLGTGPIGELVKDWPTVIYSSFEELAESWRVD